MDDFGLDTVNEVLQNTSGVSVDIRAVKAGGCAVGKDVDYHGPSPLAITRLAVVTITTRVPWGESDLLLIRQSNKKYTSRQKNHNLLIYLIFNS
jgi:hypothetical protein